MADDVEDNDELNEPVLVAEKAEKPQEDNDMSADTNIEPAEALVRNTSSSSFISKTESMRNAARTKVDTIIAQVRQSLKEKDEYKDGDGEDNADSDAKDALLKGEFDSKVVIALFDSVVGGSFDLELNYNIRDSFDILAIFDLFERVSREAKFQILVILHAVVKKSVENLQTCTKAGLISKLLDRISNNGDDMITDKMIELVGTLATYSITVKELKHFLAALKMTDDHKWPPNAFKLLGILKRMPEKHGPDVYFDFSGKVGTGIVLPPLIRWPHQPGFAFSTWLQLDAAHLSSVEQSMKPHIYSFMNSKGFGYSAHFSGPMLVIEVHGKANKIFTILVKFEFRPQIWYHVCVTHTYNRFKSSELRCFVNGQMVTSGDIHIPSSRDAMDKCFIGLGQTGMAPDQKFSFKGQMAAVYLFGEALSQNTIAAIYRLGPGYKGKFKFESELDIPLYDMDRKVLFDGKLGSSVVFTYNPKAIETQMCLESSPNDSKTYFLHSSRAIMLEGVQSVVTQSLQAALHSLGGIQMLYPLFTQLDCPFDGEDHPEKRLCILLLSLIYDLLRGSAMCQQQLLQSQGFMIIGHILEKSSECHLSEEVVDILLGLARYLMSTPSATGLLGSLLDHILLNPALWIKTPLTLQANLLSLFATGYVGGLDYAGYIRKEVGVPRLMLMLRKYYSLSSDSGKPARSSKEEIISLRAFMLLLIKQMIIKGDGIQNDELRSYLVYLTIENEEENYTDVLQLLLSTMCEMPETIVQCFDNLEGFRIIFLKLLVSENELVRVYSLKIIGAYIKSLTLVRKVELVEKYGFISMIGAKLRPFDITMMTYNALFEILTARVSKHVITGRHAEPDSTVILYHPTILPVIVNLILQKRNSILSANTEQESKAEKMILLEEEEVYDITKIFLSDLVLVLNHSKDNRRLMLQLMCWQDWLFSLAYFESKNMEETKITDKVFTIVRMLLHYAIQNEKEGWRVWVDTLAILHGKISEYNFRKSAPRRKKARDNLDERETDAPAMKNDRNDEIKQEFGLKMGAKEEISEESTRNDENGHIPVTSNDLNTSSPSKNREELDANMDVRMKFFYSILKSDGQSKSAFSMKRERTSSDTLKRSRSESDMDGPSGAANADNQDISKSNEDITDATNTAADDDAIEPKEDDGQVKDDSESAKDDEQTSVSVAHEKSTELQTESSVSENEKQERLASVNSRSLDIGIGEESTIKTTFIGAPALEAKEEIVESAKTIDGVGNAEAQPSPSRSKSRPYIDVPEFTWSTLHQRLLTELLFAIESDLQVWKTHTFKSINDFIASRESHVYVVNLCHMVSILSDSLIFCCGGLLPLLSSATSRNFANDVLEPCGGMSLDTSFSFLNRVMDLVDVIAFASSVSFSSVESHRNMSAGGVLRQCVRLVFCSAARNRVVCRQRELPYSPLGSHKRIVPKSMKETEDAIKTLIASTQPATNEDVMQNIPGHMTTITQPERLLQDMDLNRLRALVYREVEDSRQSQYVALVVVYYIAVLMVARYRDILENETGNASDRRSHSANYDGETIPQRVRAETWAGTAQQPLSYAFKPPGERPEKKQSEEKIDFSKGFAGTPGAAVMEQTLTLEQRIDIAFKTSCCLLKEILFDFAHYLSRVIVGSRGQDLIADGLGSLKSEESTVELVMLMCSQEWQNSLQKHAGAAFMDLINEGRMISHSTRDRIVITASEARDILREKEDYDRFRNSQFDSICAKTEVLYYDENRMYDEFFRAKRRRNSAMAEKLLEKTFDILTSEFGAWPVPERLEYHVFYKLDNWEDDLRRRMRIIKNQLGTTHPEGILEPVQDEAQPKVRSYPNLKYHLYRQKTLDQTSNGSVSEEEAEEGELEVGELSLEDQNDHKSQELEILHTVGCHMIAPGVFVAGTLAITSSYLYFSADDDDPALKKIDAKVLAYCDCLNIKCAFSEITAIFGRRYLLQNKAIEIFVSCRRSYMFTFDSHKTVKDIVQYLPAVGVGSNYGLPRTRYISLASPKYLFMKSNMLQRWQIKEISNFEYLMFLNTISGRTMNDLNQYPVFPWVLNDYDSETIDLQNHGVYRDLSKPIGAINPYRLGQFVERFNTWDKNDDIPAFHYGTHYSTAGFVLNWLIRLEPFTTLFLSLQNGKFDHPNRTFSSIKRSWENCQRDTSDVKELIPELFYLPDMMKNDNQYVFGEDEDGNAINDVQLPKWAKSADEFIRIHRQALESDYVTNNLHRWIDLIFGFKQRGVEAEHAANVFYYLTYEGSVDLDSITDHVTKEAIEQQIKSFGQTPSQLLTTPHPARDQLEQKGPEDKEPHKSIFLTFVVTLDAPVMHIAANINQKNGLPAIVTISANQMFSVNKWFNHGGPITSFQSLRNVQIEQDPVLETSQARSRRFLGEPLDESIIVSPQCFCVTHDNRFIVACGYWDKSFKSFSTDSGKLSQCVFGHLDVVTCLAYSKDNISGSSAIIVSGSRDATVLVWIWDNKRNRVVVPNESSSNSVAPLAICTGHEFSIVCLDVNASLGIVASGSTEGPCLLHSINGELLRSLHSPVSSARPSMIKVGNDGLVIVNYSPNDRSQLATFTINGKFLKEIGLDNEISDMAITSDGFFFITGGTNRCFQIWRSFDLALMSVYPPCESSITAVSLTGDQRCLVAGLTNGAIIAIAMDFSMWPRR